MNRDLKAESEKLGPKSVGTRGVALIVVLGLLVIILGLAVTFLNRTTIERGASASYAASAATRQYADTVVNLVQGQIHHASSLGANVAWASQPGMIRTFAAGSPGSYTASTNSLLNFKLYSAPDMVTSATTFTGDVPPADWADKAENDALWTDLNAPVRGIFPVLAPQPASGGAEEFSLASTPGATVSQPVPMPVRWLYLLQNGEIVAPGGSGNAVSVVGDAADNPIIGRIAFWTDDETCKVNINTASEGTFWDVPRANSDQEKNLAKYQPAQKEFQRYPGHPAMTSLNAVFPSLATTDIYNITPRVIGGGSNGGTVVPPSGAVLTTDADRLYASVDELIFNAGGSPRGANNGLTQSQLDQARFFLTASSRAPEVTLFNTPRVAIWPIDSDSPAAYRTAFDSLLAFCSTINGHPYFFQRHDPKSATADASIARNMSLCGYLQKLTDVPFPGFGGQSFATKFGTSDRDQILTEIFDYVRSANLDDSGLLAANRFYGRGDVAGGAGKGQVTPSRIGTTQGFGRFPVISEVGIQFICTADGGGTDAIAAAGGVYGSNVAANKTLERDIPANPTLGKPLAKNQRRIEALFFWETFVPGQNLPPIYPAYSVRIRGLQNLQIANSNPAALGFPSDDNYLSYASSGWVQGAKDWGGTSSHRVSLALNHLTARGGMAADSGIAPYTRYPFVSQPITIDTTAGTMTFVGGDVTIDVYARTSTWGTGYAPTAIPVNTYTINIPGGTFPIPSLVPTGTAISGLANSTTKENWWTFSRDGCGLAGPTDPANVAHGTYPGDPKANGRIYFFHQDPGTSATLLAGAPFRAEDVVRTVVPVHSDFRILSINAGIPKTAYTKHPLYDLAQNLAHSITDSGGSGFFAGTTLDDAHLLADGLTYDSRRRPDVAISNASASTNGDWDNGVGPTSDGPYINMPDEGTSTAANPGTSVPYFDETWVYTVQSMRSPNRQMPSAGIFGSLPSSADIAKPYRTLLFRSQPGHFGDGLPSPTPAKDHLWTDLFWMPIVEPYAISEPFSTAGKINMNYQIIPFNYIRRATGMAAILRSEKIMAVPNGNANNYKYGAGMGATATRQTLDVTQTLKQFDAKFAANDIFRSASQIMEMHLIPTGETVNLTGTSTDADSVMATFWAANKLVGDNSRERPYANLLGRLTTKSNTYTVHYRVQSLKKSRTTAAGQWDKSRDKITGEFRGSTTVERYINPNETSIPDYGSSATPRSEPSLSGFYKWRVVNSRKFSP